MTDFPTIVYRTPGQHKKPRGESYDYRAAADKEAFDTLIAKGWFPSYEEAQGGKSSKKAAAPAKVEEAPIDEVSGPTREELETKAKELGVSFNARTSDKKLAERIAEALEI